MTLRGWVAPIYLPSQSEAGPWRTLALRILIREIGESYIGRPYWKPTTPKLRRDFLTQKRLSPSTCVNSFARPELMLMDKDKL